MRRTWDFDEGRGGFGYEDDVFLFTDAPEAARGAYARGALKLTLGGDETGPASGGWTRGFRLDEDQSVTLSFRFKIGQGGDEEDRGLADVRAALDGEAVAVGGQPYLARLDPGGSRKIGWTTVEIDLGRLEAGRHEIALGGFAEAASARSRIAFDDVEIQGSARRGFDLDRFEARVLRLTNAFRKENGLDPLRADPNLTAAAEEWSREMARGDFVGHSDTLDLITGQGYDPVRWGENIAWGYASPKKVVEGWIDSPGHRDNLLNPDFEQIGLGYYRLRDDEGEFNAERYWTQIFGAPSDDYMA